MYSIKKYIDARLSRSMRCLIQAILAIAVAIAQFVISGITGSTALYSDASHRVVDALTFLYGSWCARFAQRASSSKAKDIADALGGLMSSAWQFITGILVFLEAIGHMTKVKPVSEPKKLVITGAVAIGVDVIGLMLIGHDHGHDGCGCGHSHGYEGWSWEGFLTDRGFLAEYLVYNIFGYRLSYRCAVGHDHQITEKQGQGHDGGCCGGHDDSDHGHPVHQHGQGGCCGHGDSHGTAGNEGARAEPVHQHEHGAGCCSGHGHSHGTAGNEGARAEPVHQHEHGVGCCSGHGHSHGSANRPSTPLMIIPPPPSHDHDHDYANSAHGNSHDVEKGVCECNSPRPPTPSLEDSNPLAYPVARVFAAMSHWTSNMIGQRSRDGDVVEDGVDDGNHHYHYHHYHHHPAWDQSHHHQARDQPREDIQSCQCHGAGCHKDSGHVAHDQQAAPMPSSPYLPEKTLYGASECPYDVYGAEAEHDHHHHHGDGCSHSHSHPHPEKKKNIVSRFFSTIWNSMLAVVGARKRDDGSLNSHGLHLHIVCDLLNNVGVIIAGLLVWLFPDNPGVRYADPVVGLMIGLMMIATSIPIMVASANKLIQTAFQPNHQPDDHEDLEAGPLPGESVFDDLKHENDPNVLRYHLESVTRFVRREMSLAARYRSISLFSFGSRKSTS